MDFIVYVQMLHGMLTSIRSNARTVIDDVQLRFQRLHSVLQARYVYTFITWRLLPPPSTVVVMALSPNSVYRLSHLFVREFIHPLLWSDITKYDRGRLFHNVGGRWGMGLAQMRTRGSGVNNYHIFADVLFGRPHISWIAWTVLTKT